MLLVSSICDCVSFSMATQATPQSAKGQRRKWAHFEVANLVKAMKDMVNSGAYKGDNGFKPGYITFLEETLKISCPNSGIKGRPHIESHIKTLKRDWSMVHDMVNNTRNGSGGFFFDSSRNMVVASDDVWDEYTRHSPEASQWRNKLFHHYEDCCIIFGRDRATGEEARAPADILEEVNAVADSSSSDSSKPEDVIFSTGSKSRSRSATPEVTNARKKKKQSVDNNYGDSIVKAAQIIAEGISKAQIGIINAIMVEKENRQLVAAAMEEITSLPALDRGVYATKVMSAPELMDVFLSLQPSIRLPWLQKMFPGLL
ncbi:hypothetical protein Sjap_013878 [Stephania japonica]|uniref:Myb/SANT-like domain-containing protein n=1 Tax=Stephania japonica TaxID=461633 RepID=A0AAP0J1A7_9MAGN